MPDGPIRRKIITPRVPSTRPGQNLLLRTQHDQPLTSTVPRRTRIGSHGQAGPWSQSMYLRPTDAAMTPAWSYTRSARHA
jgi:hypothetical protein